MGIIIEKQQGGLGILPVSEDHITGLLFYTEGNIPAAFAEGARRIYSIEDAETLGIVDDKSDETKATGGNILITTAGSAGNIHTVTMDGVTLGAYTVVTSDDAEDVAVGLRSAINALTADTGYSAAGSGANVALTAPAGKGDSINAGSHLAYTATGTGAATVTQFSGGVDAYLDLVHYHVSEFFRINKNAELWLLLADAPESTPDYEEIIDMQRTADGKIKQFGVHAPMLTLESANITPAKTITETLEEESKPCIIILSLDAFGFDYADFASLNLRSLNSAMVSVCIGQDGDAIGAALFADKNQSINCIGAMMGAISLAKVSENIGWVAKYKMDNVELNVPALGNGVLYKTLTPAQETVLNNNGYIFLKKYVGDAQTYFNDSHSCILVTNDYGYIEMNRTMNKAIRGIRSNLLQQVNGPVLVDATTGKLSTSICKYIEALANQPLEAMQRDGELSGYIAVVDPNQNVLATSEVVVVVKNVPVGVARNIRVKIGFTTKI